MTVPVELSPGRNEPGSPFYQEPDDEPDDEPDRVYEQEIEKRLEAEHVAGDYE